jgi:acetyltransferase-like isoleucine patch superfamily enzyme
MNTAIISANIRVRHPDHFEVGDHSIVDDFCYFSARVKIGVCSHIASGCSIAGGREQLCTIGDFTSLSSGVKIWCASDDFVNDIVTIIPPGMENPKNHIIAGHVTLGNYTAVGSNSVIMPRNTIPEGTVIGALSFVPADFEFEPWSVYVGTPIRLAKKRNKRNVLEQVEKLRAYLASTRR